MQDMPDKPARPCLSLIFILASERAIGPVSSPARFSAPFLVTFAKCQSTAAKTRQNSKKSFFSDWSPSRRLKKI